MFAHFSGKTREGQGGITADAADRLHCSDNWQLKRAHIPADALAESHDRDAEGGDQPFSQPFPSSPAVVKESMSINFHFSDMLVCRLLSVGDTCRLSCWLFAAVWRCHKLSFYLPMIQTLWADRSLRPTSCIRSLQLNVSIRASQKRKCGLNPLVGTRALKPWSAGLSSVWATPPESGVLTSTRESRSWKWEVVQTNLMRFFFSPSLSFSPP